MAKTAVEMRNGYTLSGKDALLLVVATALALGSLKPTDPFIIIPMLATAGASFVGLFFRLSGSWMLRSIAAVVAIGTLVFVGWRDLRQPVTTAVPSQSSGLTVNQQADGTNCSNIAGSRDVTVICGSEEKKHGKP